MSQKDEKKQFKVMLGLFASLLIGLVVFVTVMFIYKAGEMNVYSIMSVAIALLILIFALYVVIKRKKEIDKGIPQHDERSKKIMNLAASRAFYISLYWFLAIMWFDILFEKMQLETNSVVGLGIAGMAIIWVICQFWYNKFGDKHL
ncbi:hypothetical protein ACFL2U_01405 [Patescibacteria group bacterium]